MEGQEKELTLTENEDGSMSVDGLAESADEAHLAGGTGGPGEDHDEDDGEEDDDLSRKNASEEHGESRHDDKNLTRTERNRLERKRRKEARERVVDQLRQENTILRQSVERLAQGQQVILQRQTGTEMATALSELDKAKRSYEYYDQQLEIAVKGNNTAGIVEAMEGRTAAKARFEEVDRVRQQIERAAAGGGGAERRPDPVMSDPSVKNYASEWAARRQWMMPGSADFDREDARIVAGIDAGVLQDGFDPRTPAYWDELTNRVKKYLPHRAERGYNGGKPNGEDQGGSDRRSGPTGQGRESGVRGPGGGGKGFVLSKERIDAMKETGDWDDPARRAAMIKQYRDYDREMSERGGR